MTRNVVVTGAASGIGLAIAHAFTSLGDQVWICDADPDAVAKLAGDDQLVHAEICDISQRAAAQAFIAEAAQSLGGIDILVNNAGISGQTAPLDDIDANDWARTLDVNLSGTFHITQAAVPHLRASGDGVVIIMSSLAGRMGYENRLAYSTTKWGLVGFTKTLAIELGGSGIRVNAIQPGAVAGERLDRVMRSKAQISGTSLEDFRDRALQNQSIKEFTTREQVAGLCVFLASTSARTISGQTFPIDGDPRMAL